MRILIAEDEERSRRGLADVIESISERFKVCAQASNGRQAVHLAMRFKPEVVVTDIRMPNMDGLDMIRELKGKGCPAQFVVISAFAEFEYAQRAIELGVKNYIVKPVSLEAIEKSLRAIEGELCAKSLAAGGGKALASEFPDAHPCVRRALADIERRYGERMSLEELAEGQRITPEYLSTLFHRDAGMTFSTFLRNYRIEQAKTMLDEGALDVAEVASAVGYGDAKYFARVFKERVGVSPAAYARGAN